MKWRVQVADVAGGRRLFGEVLHGLSIDLLEEDDGLFLVSEAFETLDTAGEVHKLASRVQSTIEEAAKGIPEIQLGLKIGSVFEETASGRRIHTFITVSTGHIGLTGQVATLKVEPAVQLSTDEQKRLEEEQGEREYQRSRRTALSRIISAFRDDRALQIQRLLCGELTPHTMGHIAELIQDDIGVGMTELASDKQLTRFERSINHPHVFGEQARHIVPKVEPPPKPMSLEEARDFIRGLADRWMDRKAGIGDDA